MGYRGLFVESDRFDVCKFQHSVSGQFAAEPAVLDATKRNPRVRNYNVVHAHEAGCNLTRDLLSPSNILAPDTCSKAETARVGKLDSLIVILDYHNGRDRSEEIGRASCRERVE